MRGSANRGAAVLQSWQDAWRSPRGECGEHCFRPPVYTIRETLRAGALRMTALPRDILNVVAGGDIVMTEHLDHFQVGDNQISVPCMGIFELRNGRIAAWRGY